MVEDKIIWSLNYYECFSNTVPVDNDISSHTIYITHVVLFEYLTALAVLMHSLPFSLSSGMFLMFDMRNLILNLHPDWPTPLPGVFSLIQHPPARVSWFCDQLCYERKAFSPVLLQQLRPVQIPWGAVKSAMMSSKHLGLDAYRLSWTLDQSPPPRVKSTHSDDLTYVKCCLDFPSDYVTVSSPPITFLGYLKCSGLDFDVSIPNLKKVFILCRTETRGSRCCRALFPDGLCSRWCITHQRSFLYVRYRV